jgi:hypothetical protein
LVKGARSKVVDIGPDLATVTTAGLPKGRDEEGTGIWGLEAPTNRLVAACGSDGEMGGVATTSTGHTLAEIKEGLLVATETKRMSSVL